MGIVHFLTLIGYSRIFIQKNPLFYVLFPGKRRQYNDSGYLDMVKSEYICLDINLYMCSCIVGSE